MDFLAANTISVSESRSVMSNSLQPMDYTVHGILQARILEWVAFPFSKGSSQPGIEPRSPTLQADSLPAEPQGKPKNTGVGSHPFSRGLPNQGIEPRFPTLQGDSLPGGPPGKPKNTGVGSPSLLQQIFPTQESKQGLLHYRRILYQLRYQGSPGNYNTPTKSESKPPLAPAH